MTPILTTIASIPFAMAVCALLKRQWPQVTGWITPVVILACTTLAAVLGQYSAAIPPIVWVIAGPIVAAVSALGLHEAAGSIAEKGGTAKTIQVVSTDDPRATIPVQGIPNAGVKIDYSAGTITPVILSTDRNNDPNG